MGLLDSDMVLISITVQWSPGVSWTSEGKLTVNIHMMLLHEGSKALETAHRPLPTFRSAIDGTELRRDVLRLNSRHQKSAPVREGLI